MKSVGAWSGIDMMDKGNFTSQKNAFDSFVHTNTPSPHQCINVYRTSKVILYT